MLIVEGPDGVGKTTLCRKLLESLPTHIYAHFSRLPAGFDYYWGYVERASRYIVQDRFHLSEVAYARARGDSSRLDTESYQILDGHLRLLGAYTILVTATQDLLASRWGPDQMYSLEKTLAAGRAFDQVHEEHAINRIVPDIDFRVRCTVHRPWVSDEEIAAILEAYRVRQSLIDDVARRRRLGLGRA